VVVVAGDGDEKDEYINLMVEIIEDVRPAWLQK